MDQAAAKIGWPVAREVQADPDTGENYRVTWAAGPGLSMHYIEDHESSECFVLASGTEQHAVEGTVTFLEHSLPVWLPAEILAESDHMTTPADRARALLRIGISAPRDLNQDYFDRIMAGLRDPHPYVRQAAVWATIHAEWPQFIEPLRELASSDPDEEIREDAEIVLDTFRDAGIGES